MISQRLCKKCVLPECKPDIWLREDGTCNICVDFEKSRISTQSVVLPETELIKILNTYKQKDKYDCLVMCSGGKDSTASLYYMKKRYRLNPLAFTFDHGFENKEALENIKNAVDILNVDWVYFKSDFMKDIFSLMVRSMTKAPICHVCAIWYIQLIYDFAARYKIPLIVAGWTKGQSIQRGESGEEYKSMSKATTDFIINHLHKDPKYKGFPRSISEAINISQKKFKIRAVSPHWYLQWDADRIAELLNRELKWKAPSLSYPAGSTNCLMNFVSVYLTAKHYGYTHYHIEMSKQIRLGELSQEEALNKLEIRFDEEMIKSILEKIGCRLES
jgi:tRNA(Ile)-lysidine synthase TilS/MesJ